MLNSISENFKETYIQKIIKFIALRPRSKNEIETRLQQYFYKSKKEVNKEVVDSIIKDLSEQKYIDDDAFCTWFLQSRLNQKKKSLMQIKNELYKFGISKEIISECMKNADEEGINYEISTITKLLNKVSLKYRKITDIYKRKQLIYNFLVQKGFKESNINVALEDQAENFGRKGNYS